MLIPSRWRRLSLVLLLMPLLLTACFRDTSESIDEQPVARAFPSPTELVAEEATALPATALPEPAATEAEAEVQAEAEVDQFALTATALIAGQTQLAPGADGPPSDAASGQQGVQVQATAIPIPRSTIPPGEDCVHEIRAGETLFQLSLAYGVTVDAIAAASDIANPDRISVGQPVTIPDCGTTGFIPPPTSVPAATIEPVAAPATSAASDAEVASSQDTLSALVAQAQETLLGNAESNSQDAFSAQTSGASASSGNYTVQQNDTLFMIASRYGTTVDVLAALNDIEDVDSVNVGDVLQLP